MTRFLLTTLCLILLWTEKMTKSSAFVTNNFQSKSTLKSKRYAEPPKGWQEQVLSKLSTILDPDLGMDIVSLNFVKNLEFSEKSNEYII